MVWTRRLGFEFGHDAAAALAVVTAFFAGFALGAWSLGAWVRSTPRPARVYAILEVVIAVWVAASPALLPTATQTTLRWLGHSPTPAWHWTLVFATSLLVLLPATAAMGATLPALERFASQATGRSDTAGPLYAANTLGAVFGTLLGAFVLIPAWGFSASLKVLAVLPLLAALVALALERAVGFHRPFEHGPIESHQGSASWTSLASGHGAARRATRTGSGVSSGRLALTAFATGLLGIGLELLGMRLLAQVIENTVYSFASLLAVYLVGTAVGAALERRWLPQTDIADKLCRLLTGLALATAMSGWVGWLLPRLERLLGGAADASLGALRLGDVWLAAAVFGWPTLFMGASFSALARAAGHDRGGLARLVALNAMGAAWAPLVFGVLLVPAIGSRWSLAVIVLAYAALAFQRRVATVVLLAGSLALVLPLPRRLPPLEPAPGVEVRTWVEGVTDTIAVTITPDGHRALQVNNRYTMGGTASANAERRQAHVPLLLHPQPRRALFLGTGTGITSGAALAHPALEADGVELVPEVAAVMPVFAPENRLPDWSPRVRQYVADARRFVRSTTNRYDVIVADLFHPARDGAGALYTREHFAVLRDRLAPGGLCCQWLPLYQLEEPTLQIIVRTFLEVFPHTRAWLLRLNVETPALGLVGSLEAGRYPPDWLEQRLAAPELRAALQPLALIESLSLFGLMVADADALRRYAGEAPLNTEDRPLVMFTAPRASGLRPTPPDERLFALIERCGFEATNLVESVERPDSFPDRLNRTISARNAYLLGLRLEREGQRQAALRLYLESVRLSPDFSTGYAHCLTLAVQQSKENPAAARRLLEELSALQPHRQAAQELLKRMGDPVVQ